MQRWLRLPLVFRCAAEALAPPAAPACATPRLEPCPMDEGGLDDFVLKDYTITGMNPATVKSTCKDSRGGSFDMLFRAWKPAQDERDCHIHADHERLER